MITGVYYPEINGAVLQCKQLISNMFNSIHFTVLTGTDIEKYDGRDCVEGVSVTRVLMPKRHKINYIIGGIIFHISLIKMLKKIDVVHIHGYSKRNAIAILISRFFGKKLVIKMSSYGLDDPMSVKESSLLYWSIFKLCHAYIGLSPAFSISYEESKLPKYKYNLIPNSVNVEIFCPASEIERKRLRDKYEFSQNDKVIIYVGHFSLEKQPMLLYKAFVSLCERQPNLKIIFIGQTKNNYEIDNDIIELIRKDALHRGIIHRIYFVEETQHVNEYMKISDVFVMPSCREGMPNVLLEAMASALPCVVRLLPGVTDWLIDDQRTGVLFNSDNPSILADKIFPYISKPVINKRIGITARQFVENYFSCDTTAREVFDLYKKTL
jgi:glycosyltransferase involved in cell wall biosynthesis